MSDYPANPPRFHANTGARSYDSIDFSGQPIAELLFDRQTQFAMVRHFGVHGRGMVESQSSHPDAAALIVNMSSGGRYRGRVCGEKLDKPLRRGDVSFVPAGADVEIEYPAAHGCLLLHIPDARLRALASDQGTAQLVPMHNEPNERMAQLIQMIERKVRTPGFASELLVDGLLRALVTTLTSRARQPRELPERIHLPQAKVRRVNDYIEAHLETNVSLKDLAEVAGLSPYHFARVFKLATGESPYHYLGSRRLARAQEMLSATELPLAELALACGFASQSHFTAAFTKSVGISPGRYRKERRD